MLSLVPLFPLPQAPIPSLSPSTASGENLILNHPEPEMRRCPNSTPRRRQVGLLGAGEDFFLDRWSAHELCSQLGRFTKSLCLLLTLLLFPHSPYNAAKAAVRHLAASLAVEWAHAGIRVNCISPGYMLTALTEKIMSDNPALKKQWTSLIPQGAMGSPEDLMGPVTFLLSDSAKYVTGADLRVDGGYTVT